MPCDWFAPGPLTLMVRARTKSFSARAFHLSSQRFIEGKLSRSLDYSNAWAIADKF